MQVDLTYITSQSHNATSILTRGGTGSEFRREPDPGTWPLLPGRIWLVAKSEYFNM